MTQGVLDVKPEGTAFDMVALHPLLVNGRMGFARSIHVLSPFPSAPRSGFQIKEPLGSTLETILWKAKLRASERSRRFEVARAGNWMRASRVPDTSPRACRALKLLGEGATFERRTVGAYAARASPPSAATRSPNRSPCTVTCLRMASAARSASPLATASTISSCSAKD